MGSPLTRPDRRPGGERGVPPVRPSASGERSPDLRVRQGWLGSRSWTSTRSPACCAPPRPRRSCRAFRDLAADDIATKGVDAAGVADLVTVADLEAERLITEGLAQLAPGVAVIGEEAVAADPARAEGLADRSAYFVLDPVDGTANFVAGDPAFGVMLALVHHREVAVAWILLPVTDRLYVAERGAGSFVDGRRIDPPAPVDVADQRAWLSTRYLPPPWAQTVAANESSFAEVSSGPGAAAAAYAGILDGEAEVGLVWRTLPWDHAPGALLLRERAVPRGASTAPTTRPATASVRAAPRGRDASAWPQVRRTLLG